MSSTRVVFALVAAIAVWCGCATDPDGQSGGDGRRDQAQALVFEEWVTDETGVFYGGGDRTDWRKIEVERGGKLYIEVAVDNRDATVSVSLFDKYGRQLIEKVKKGGSSEHVKIEGPATRGRYFVRVQAVRSEDRSVYSIRASMEGGGGYVGDIPPPE